MKAEDTSLQQGSKSIPKSGISRGLICKCTRDIITHQNPASVWAKSAPTQSWHKPYPTLQVVGKDTEFNGNFVYEWRDPIKLLCRSKICFREGECTPPPLLGVQSGFPPSPPIIGELEYWYISLIRYQKECTDLNNQEYTTLSKATNLTLIQKTCTTRINKNAL